jgi:hypothetical protein
MFYTRRALKWGTTNCNLNAPIRPTDGWLVAVESNPHMGPYSKTLATKHDDVDDVDDVGIQTKHPCNFEG